MNAAELTQAFQQVFPEASPPIFCYAPGRVNLIGEHIDYNGMPVLPMTMDRRIAVAFSARSDALIRLVNADPTFPPATFDNLPDIPPSQKGAWENYGKAAIQGINQYFDIQPGKGIDLLVTSDIPIAAGLSSSSGLIVATALAYLHVLGKTLGGDIERIELAQCLAQAERYAGAHGGGMDQAIILLGAKDTALKIDFFPLRIEPVPLPLGYCLVVCNSLVKAEKTGAARHRYNEGPLIGKILTALVQKHLQSEWDEDIEINRLGDLWLGHLCLTHQEVQELFEAVFTCDQTTVDEIAEALQIKPARLQQEWLADIPSPPDGLSLKSKARHQRTEFHRVEMARDACEAQDGAALGRLMVESHRSCADDYGVSCPELDRLVELALEAGAVGARLTGAGFGGCTINLVPETEVDHFQQTMTQNYYRDFLNTEPPAHAILRVKPCAAADYS